MDRRDPAATPAMAAHAAVLDAIAQIVTAAHRHGRQVSVSSGIIARLHCDDANRAILCPSAAGHADRILEDTPYVP
ncbi:hypothetical protein [Streptomyces sp. KR80]|uniref:hypothetical protein n=1 Tax=Streptomyces sp. KR80 TaxID=3457426 RepID=UPI003FD2066D